MASRSGPSQHEHSCLAYRSQRELQAAAARFLTRGAERGEKLMYVSAQGRSRQRSEARALEREVGAAVAVVPVDELYRSSGAFVPEEAAALFGARVAAALDEGYTGLCAVADATGLASEDWRVFAGLEGTVDAAIARGLPLSALCAYDAWLPGHILEAMAALHRESNQPAPFRLYHEGSLTRLTGEVDSGSAQLLEDPLATSISEGEIVELEASSLDYIDAAGVRALRHVARHLAKRVELLDPSPVARSVIGILQPLAGDHLVTAR